MKFVIPLKTVNIKRQCRRVTQDNINWEELIKDPSPTYIDSRRYDSQKTAIEIIQIKIEAIPMRI